jgi:hypothetical protein
MQTKLVKAALRPEKERSVLSIADQTAVAVATCRATFWSTKFDVKSLEQTLSILAADLPMLAGRCVVTHNCCSLGPVAMFSDRT